jgi:uncharacterized membrane protein
MHDDKNPTQSLDPVQKEQSVTTSSQPEKSTDAVSSDIQQLKDLITKIKLGIKEKKEQAKLNKLQDKNSQNPKKSFFASNKLLVVALIIFLIFTILLIAASLYKSLAGKKTAPTNLASPTPFVNVINPQISTPSKYATDSAVVDVEKKVKQLDGQMSDGLNDPDLTPPSLDFNVNF